jgi:hypothetical protein
MNVSRIHESKKFSIYIYENVVLISTVQRYLCTKQCNGECKNKCPCKTAGRGCSKVRPLCTVYDLLRLHLQNSPGMPQNSAGGGEPHRLQQQGRMVYSSLIEET